MKFLMSRFGGHAIKLKHGKASNDELPNDQSLDNMLDNYAKEIIPNYFYISSYDAKPVWMGAREKLKHPKEFRIYSPTKLGTLKHDFNEVLSQYRVLAITDIYLSYHNWTNVYALIIKTHKLGVNSVVDDYLETYDYVLQVFIRRKNPDTKLKDRPADLNKIMLILFYKMGLIFEGDIKSFTPSKTTLGKIIHKDFLKKINKLLVGVDSDDKLSKLLNKFPKYQDDRI